MGETFLININCSKILENCDETQYTMCVDSTKMSTVYELTEWIRWMFSLEHCFYLVHENSVIHELEDIQFLSKLKNFEIRPCGQPNCVHKKMYRTLLDNLNVFVSWNNIKVHKYFLEKLTKMAKNLSQENLSGDSLPKLNENVKNGQTSVRSSAKTDYNKFFSCVSKQDNPRQEGTPLSKHQVLIDNFVSRPGNSRESSGEANCSGDAALENIFNNFKDSFNNTENKHLMADAEKRYKALINHSSPIKNEPRVKPETSTHPAKPSLNKSSRRRVEEESSSSTASRHLRPFSVGELLSNIRENFEKHNVEETNISNNTLNNSSAVESGSIGGKIGAEMNLFATDDSMGGARKRSRTRKRKRSKKHSPEEGEHISPFLGAILNVGNAKCSLTSPKSANKPSHIRFDFDNDLMETEGELSAVNESRLKTGEGLKDSSMTVSQTEPNTSDTMMNGDKNQLYHLENGFSMNSKETGMEISSEIVPPVETEEKLIDFDDQTNQNASQLCNTPETPKPLNPDLKMLLNLKEKFKSAIVIERFY